MIYTFLCKALTGIAKQRLQYGLLSALDDSIATRHLSTEKQKPGTLYNTRHFIDSNSGKTVMETAV